MNLAVNEVIPDEKTLGSVTANFSKKDEDYSQNTGSELLIYWGCDSNKSNKCIFSRA